MAGQARAITALIVEDEPILRIDAVDMLQDAGLVAIEAGNAWDALALLERHAVDLLFTDVQMPGELDGFGLARQVRERWPRIAIVVCSAYRSPQPGELPDGAHFIAKPFSAQVVRKTIESLDLSGTAENAARTGQWLL